jgi:hypothetical protein
VSGRSLWTATAGGPSPLAAFDPAKLVALTPEQLTELKAKIAERTKAFRGDAPRGCRCICCERLP